MQEVGEEVFLFKKGDRVAAFHEMLTEHGSFAVSFVLCRLLPFGHCRSRNHDGTLLSFMAVRIRVLLRLWLELAAP